jgi:hypothetical protein
VACARSRASNALTDAAYGGPAAREKSNRPDIAALEAAFDAAERDARAVVTGLTGTLGAWRTDASSWSVAECLDHLAVANRTRREITKIRERFSDETRDVRKTSCFSGTRQAWREGMQVAMPSFVALKNE